MALPSPGRLERLFAPWARPIDVPVRVWGTDCEGRPAARGATDPEPPRLLCLAGGDESLVVVRQTRSHDGGLDGFAVPWSLVTCIVRERRFGHDVLCVEVAGHAPMRAHVGTHLLLRRNRAAAGALCAMAGRAPARAAPASAAPRCAPAPESDTRPIPT